MQDFELEIYQMFIDQIESEVSTIKYNISILQKKDKTDEAINTLFRTFHNYKATAAYFHLTPFFNLALKVEIILNSLRETHQFIPNSIVIWLYQVVAQIVIWLKEMYQNNTLLSPIPKSLKSKIKLSKPYITPKEKLKTLHILYLDKNKKRAKKMGSFFKKIVKKISYISTVEILDISLQIDKYDIIITNMEEDNYLTIDICRKKQPTLPIITIFDKIDAKTSIALLKKSVSHVIRNPLDPKIIYNELRLITNSHFSSVNLIIDNDTIKEFIQTIEPLSNTVSQIIQICDDEDIPLKTLIKVVKTDPLLSAKILNLANSPLYGSIVLRTIDQAITRLGKNSIKALTLKNLDTMLKPLELSPYNITENTFSKVAMTRLALMLKWYAKISISDLSILSSTALLGNIGQILISKEIVHQKQSDLFKSMVDSFGIKYAEETTVFTTTPIVSSQILNYWKLSRAIVNIIMYSDNPEEAPQEIIKLAVANHIVYTLIPLNGEILKEVPNELLDIMEKYNFQLNILEKALNSINEIKFI
ncbi:MAG: HDOD domain-containing protein [Campylobacterota bacterium]|nr:HDOD domain-containing protein [Campylobacterota bacterium]